MSLSASRTIAARAFAAAVGPAAGPVHLNFPFDKPLEPLDGPDAFALEHPLAATGRPAGALLTNVPRLRAAAGA